MLETTMLILALVELEGTVEGERRVPLNSPPRLIPGFSGWIQDPLTSRGRNANSGAWIQARVIVMRGWFHAEFRGTGELV